MGDRDSVLAIIAQVARLSWILEPKEGDALRQLAWQAKVQWDRSRTVARVARPTVLTMAGETGADRGSHVLERCMVMHDGCISRLPSRPSQDIGSTTCLAPTPESQPTKGGPTNG